MGSDVAHWFRGTWRRALVYPSVQLLWFLDRFFPLRRRWFLPLGGGYWRLVALFSPYCNIV